MNIALSAGALRGTVCIPASKSQAHRLLICAALGKTPVTLHCDGLSKDITATAHCLQALGAEVALENDSLIRLTPGTSVRVAALPCGESGSTLRFLL
ncbi:MAG: 3-phosphoshikimate 1-carboxyvinyltransferase, partial [Ruminococcaceae bacterium]|nr:3-phosphoshikimate 1-carboxyvinyltransferase [Oscillospiraceae bacterium]